MMKTEWGVDMNVKHVPNPEFVTYGIQGNKAVYGWKIDQHGIFVLGDTREQCIAEFKRAYQSETGIAI
jgi:hypothetical protein